MIVTIALCVSGFLPRSGVRFGALGLVVRNIGCNSYFAIFLEVQSIASMGCRARNLLVFTHPEWVSQPNVLMPTPSMTCPDLHVWKVDPQGSLQPLM